MQYRFYTLHGVLLATANPGTAGETFDVSATSLRIGGSLDGWSTLIETDPATPGPLSGGYPTITLEDGRALGSETAQLSVVTWDVDRQTLMLILNVEEVVAGVPTAFEYFFPLAGAAGFADAIGSANATTLIETIAPPGGYWDRHQSDGVFVLEYMPVITSSEVIGSTGDDYMTVEEDVAVMLGLEGNDTIQGPSSGALHDPQSWGRLEGGPGDDQLTIYDDGLSLGGEGNDTLWGGSALNGGAGDDVIHSWRAATILGEDGNDMIFGSDQAEAIYGGAGYDVILAGVGRDSISGGIGGDRIEGGLGSDVIVGGAGNDILRGDGPSEEIEYLSWVYYSYREEGLVGLIEDTILGGDGFDTILGDRGADHIDGGADADQLFGDTGTDTIMGGTGNDMLDGGLQGDVLYGEEGYDTLEGGDGDDWLDGGVGGDMLRGGSGGDTLIGGAGNDILDGGAHGDMLFGSDGFDFINGGLGNDVLFGGADADRFHHLGTAPHGTDWIADYTAAEGDLLSLSDDWLSVADLVVSTTSAWGSGEAGVDEVEIRHGASGHLIWVLIDGAAQANLNLVSGGTVVDLLE